MYPQRELNRLAAHKVALRRNLARHRLECINAAAGVVRPLQWLDRAWAFFRRFSPLVTMVAAPLGMLVTRRLFSRSRILGSLLRWGPLLFGAMRNFRSAFEAVQTADR